MRKLWAVLAGWWLALVLVGVAQGGTFRPPDIPDGEKLTYRVYERSDEAGNQESFVSPREEITGITQIITRIQKNNKTYYRFFRAENLAGGQVSYYSYIYTDFNPFRFVVFEKWMQSPNGRTVKKEITYFDDPNYPYPADLNHFYSIPMTVRSIDFKPGAINDLKIWFSSHFTPWRMNIAVSGRETVAVPAGSFDCWKVTVTPDVDDILKKWSWIAKLLKRWIPSFYYWYSVKAPYPLIKYEGTFGPVGFSPVQVQELTGMSTALSGDLTMVKTYSTSAEDLVLWEDFKNGRR